MFKNKPTPYQLDDFFKINPMMIKCSSKNSGIHLISKRMCLYANVFTYHNFLWRFSNKLDSY